MAASLWWRNQALRSKGLIVIAIPSVILLGAIVAVYVVDAAEDRADRVVAHSLSVRTDIERTLALMDRAETSVRSHLLLPRPEFLSEYSRARRELSSALTRLHGLVQNDADQAARLRSVDTLIVDRLKALDVASRTQDDDGRFQSRSLRTGEAVLESLRSTLSIMQEDVEQDLATQIAAAERQAALARRLLLLGGLMGIGGGVVAALLFTSGLGDRMRQLGEAARDMSKGEFDTRTQPAGDEIGLLGEQLREAAHRLEEREQQLRQARDHAEAANRANIDFLSRLSDELRTPIESILGFSQVLQATGLDAERAESVDRILQAGIHLRRQIDDVLEIANIESGIIAPSPQTVRVAGILREVFDLVGPPAAQRGVTLGGLDREHDRVEVYADRQRLARVLLTLLSRAVECSRRNGRVDVTTTVGQSVFRIGVSDNGPGVAKAEVGRAFEPFEQRSSEPAIEGKGLGLFIARRLIEAMGGRIGLQSDVGSGSTFWIELPVVAAHDAVPVPAIRSPSGRSV